jgi:hypothetical protein
MAKKLYSKNKSPEAHDLLVESSNTITKKLDKPDEWEKCFVIVYLTNKWKKYFPKGTKTFRIENDSITCNYYMVIQILKDYKLEYANHTILDIKNMLVESYKKYDAYRQFILQKWEIEKPNEYRLSNSFENIIMDESYPLTQVDLSLLMYNYDLPISIINQSKINIKLIKRLNHTEDYSYYLKLRGRTEFMLFIYDKVTYKLYDKDIDVSFKKDLTRLSVLSYLKSSEY